MGTRLAFVHSWCSNPIIGRQSSPLSSKSLGGYHQRNGGISVLRRRFSTKIHLVRMNAQTEEKSEASKSLEGKELEPPIYVRIEKYVTVAAYVGFVTFALFLAPGGLSEAGQFQKILAGNIAEVNDLFFAIFNLIGATCINYAAVLNAGASQQKRLSTYLFSFVAIFVGFYSFGPYMIGRTYAPQVKREEVQQRGLLSRILESRIFGVTVLIYTLWIYGFAFGLFTPGSEQLHDAMFYASGADLSRLLVSDRLVSTTTVDTALLTALFWGPLTEDMRRRGWFTKGRETESWFTALSILLAPALGPAVYLVLRPRLPLGRKSADTQN